jgi:hypothetical protein
MDGFVRVGVFRAVSFAGRFDNWCACPFFPVCDLLDIPCESEGRSPHLM